MKRTYHAMQQRRDRETLPGEGWNNFLSMYTLCALYAVCCVQMCAIHCLSIYFESIVYIDNSNEQRKKIS